MELGSIYSKLKDLRERSESKDFAWLLEEIASICEDYTQSKKLTEASKRCRAEGNPWAVVLSERMSIFATAIRSMGVIAKSVDNHVMETGFLVVWKEPSPEFSIDPFEGDVPEWQVKKIKKTK